MDRIVGPWAYLIAVIVACVLVSAPVQAEGTEVPESPPADALPEPRHEDEDNRGVDLEVEVPSPSASPEEHRRRIAERMRELDARIATLREERSQYGIGGPITMIAIGGVVVFGATAYVIANQTCSGEMDGCGGGTTTALGVGVLGGGLAAWGIVLLTDRLGPRRRLGREIKALEKERDYVPYEVRLRPIMSPIAAGVDLQLSF